MTAQGRAFEESSGSCRFCLLAPHLRCAERTVMSGTRPVAEVGIAWAEAEEPMILAARHKAVTHLS
ncbi:hypothetical protein A5743_02725 [Mycolicibacterium conceptionense]|nr:hypothetical protein A5743_02725 [Mycolicibacterium conceptionense]